MTRFSSLALLTSLCFSGAEATEPLRLEVRAERPAASGYGVYGLNEWHVSLPENAAPTTLADWLALQMGVSVDGQGGWQQTLNIRGATGARVQMLLEGMPINTERRAGTAVHFVDPVWLSSVSLLSGAGSTVYGAGGSAVVQLQAAEWQGLRFAHRQATQGNRQQTHIAWADDDTALGIARTAQEDGESARGLPLHDRGERLSLLLRHRFTLAGGSAELLALPARLEDVGRANADFYLARITDTPQEQHLPLRFSWQHDHLEAAAFVYPSRVHSVTDRRALDRSETRNRARDTGASLHYVDQHADWRWRVGSDVVGRQNVQAAEALLDYRTQRRIQRMALDDGQDQLLGVFAESEWHRDALSSQFALRYARQQQSANGAATIRDDGVSAHAGGIYALDEHWSLRAGLGSGWRFPSLSERFYNGVTPRGDLRGEPSLRAEHSRDAELAVQFRRAGFRGELMHWRRDYDDYIERVVINARLRSYGNIDSGTVNGQSLNLIWEPAADTLLSLRSSRMHGEAADGRRIADMAPAQHDLSLRFGIAHCELSANWHWRTALRQPGPEELALPAVNWGGVAASCPLQERWRLDLQIDNVANSDFRMSADDQSALSPGRYLSLGLAWR